MAEGGAAAPVIDIFVSYAREDLTTAERLVAALQNRGWSVFLDKQTPLGQPFDTHIEAVLKSASCVVVLWSEASIKSKCVREEAAAANKRDVLAPVRLKDVDPPFGFGLDNYADLFGWTDGRAHAGFEQLLARIAELAGPPSNNAGTKDAEVEPPPREIEEVDPRDVSGARRTTASKPLDDLVSDFLGADPVVGEDAINNLANGGPEQLRALLRQAAHSRQHIIRLRRLSARIGPEAMPVLKQIMFWRKAPQRAFAEHCA